MYELEKKNAITGGVVNLFRAEWIKTAGNRWVASCLIWIFPVAAVAFVAVFSLILILVPSTRHEFRTENIFLWTDEAISVWSFPTQFLGRMVLLGFAAVMFAGEYQWRTWKNSIPRNSRVALILIKFVTLGAFVVTAFALMSVIWAAGAGLLTVIAGGTYGPKLTGDVLVDFAGNYALAATMTFTATIIAAGYAALAGMLTRSILGGVLVSFAITFIEPLSLGGLFLLAYFLDIPDLVRLYRFTPGYNLANITSWVSSNVPSRVEIVIRDAKVVYSHTMIESILVVAVWVVGLIALTTYLFQRQDITS